MERHVCRTRWFASILVLLVATGAVAANNSSAPQSIETARLQFASERRQAPAHGVYEDVALQPHGAIFRFSDQEVAAVDATAFFQHFLNTNAFAPEMSVTNRTVHALVRDVTQPLIREAITNERAYVANDWLCDSRGFNFGAVNNLGVFNVGDSAPMVGSTRLVALTPVKAKLRLWHDGTIVQESAGTNLIFKANAPGAYRVEARLRVGEMNLPWIYSGQVYLRLPDWSDLRLPSMEISPDVTVRADISYSEGRKEDAAKHKLDAYLPKGKTNVPVLLFIHGGAWKSGDRSQYPPLGNRYARAGYLTVVPNYRLAPKYPHPAQIEDVAAAFAWTVHHISAYGGDTNRIYVAGHSAGGHLAALLALDSRYLTAHNLSPQNIRGVLAISGVYDLSIGDFQSSVFGADALARREASPLSFIKPGAPPFLVAYCQWDYFTLPAQARSFHGALRQAGIGAQLVYIPAESHISEMLSFAREDDLIVNAALKFMRAGL
jgi:acetyl esterase/lipase